MMKRVFKYIVYLLFFCISLSYFLPKELFYNLLEQELEKKSVLISNESINEKFDFTILNADIFYQGIKLANIDRATLFSLFFYSKIKIENIHLEEKIRNFISTKIDDLSLNYNIFNFNKIFVEINGEFGKINGYINIFDRIINLELEDTNKKSNLIKYFKYENERYKYEYKF